MKCEEAQGLIDLQVDGALAAPRAEQLRLHVAGCQACANDLAELTQVRGLLKQAQADVPAAGVVQNLWPSLAIAAAAAATRVGRMDGADEAGSRGGLPVQGPAAGVKALAVSGVSASSQKKGMGMSTATAAAGRMGEEGGHGGQPVPGSAAGSAAGGGTGGIHPRWRKSAVVSLLMVAILVVCYAIGSGQMSPVFDRIAMNESRGGIVNIAGKHEAQNAPPADPTRTGDSGNYRSANESKLNSESRTREQLVFALTAPAPTESEPSTPGLRLAVQPPAAYAKDMADELRNKQANSAGVGRFTDQPNDAVIDNNYEMKKVEGAEAQDAKGREQGGKEAHPYGDNRFKNTPPPAPPAAPAAPGAPATPGRFLEAVSDNQTTPKALVDSTLEKTDPKRSNLYAPPTTKPGSETGAGGVGESLLSPAQKPKIIKSGNIVMEVKSYAESSQKAVDLMVRFDGYLADNKVFDLPGGAKRGEIVIRVLPEKFEALFGELKKIGKVKTERAGAQDITAAFTDTEARIRNLQITEARLQELVKSKTYLDRVEDLLRVEQELEKTRGQIEAMQGQMRVWATLIAYSSIHLTLEEPTTPVPSGSLSVEVAGLNSAKETLDAALTNLNGKLQSGQTTKRSDGTLMGTYEIQVNLANFGRMLAAIKGLGRVQDERIENQPFSNVVPEGSANVPCTLALVVYEKSAQLPGGSVQVQVASLSEAVKKLEGIAIGLEVTVVSNSTLHTATSGGGTAPGTGTAQMQLRVRAGHFAALLEALKGVGKITNQNVNGEVGMVQGGTAEMPAMLNLMLTEATPGAKERPEGTLGIEVEQFAAAQTNLQAIVSQYKIDVKEAGSRQIGKQMVAAYTLAIHADQIDAAVGALEKLGNVKVRQLKGIGLSNLAKPDPELIGTVVLSLEEKVAPSKPEPTGNLVIEAETFATAKAKLTGIVKEFNIEIEASASRQDGERTIATFTLTMPAAKVDAAEAALEGLGKVKVRQLNGIGLGDLSQFAPEAKGHLLLTVEEQAKAGDAAPGAFESSWQDSWRGFQASLGAILRGFGVLLPWLALLGLILWLVRRWWKSGAAEKKA